MRITSQMFSLELLLLMTILVSCHSKGTERLPRFSDPAISRLESRDEKMGAILPGDWLYDHDEAGQSFDQYIKVNFVSPNETQNKIYLQPIGVFSSVQRDIIAYTADYLRLFFNLETVTLPVLDDVSIPSLIRRRVGAPNEQLRTGPILDFLQQNIPDDGIVIMAITAKDLYPGENWNFVFGQARTQNRVAVSSLFNFIDVSSLDSTNYSTCLRRLIKTSSHEVSHMFSCLHCIHAVCVMNGSNSLLESEIHPNRLCSECLRKLQWNLGFDVKKRLIGMSKYFARHKLVGDYQRAKEDLELL